MINRAPRASAQLDEAPLPPAPIARVPIARVPVGSALLTLAAALTAFSGQYGYERDELYFRLLRPAWGYVDQPPLTPLLARLTRDWIADQPWAMRIPATLAAVLSVYLLVLVTRELGGGPRAQALCAWGYAFASFTLIIGHTLLTASVDLPVWPAIALFAVRGQLRADPRWWLAAGAVAGLGSYNKLLVVLLLAALAGGIVLGGPRRLLRSPWVWASVALAALIALPNIVYQATHGWPQLAMGSALAAENGGSVRVIMWPFLLLLLGPPLVPVWIAGLTGLLRRPQWRSVRFLGASFPVLLVLVFLMGAQFYYPFGLLAILFAAGCVPTSDFLDHAPTWRNLAWAAIAVNAAVSVLLGLPLIPLHVLGDTPVPAISQVARDTVGWPTYVHEIAEVYAGLPRLQQQRAVIITSNYGEAGAVARYGGQFGLPAVYSGHNQLYYQGPPPSSRPVAVIIGGQLAIARPLFASCHVAAHLDDRVGVDNEEQGEPIAICRAPVGGWPRIWPRLGHQD